MGNYFCRRQSVPSVKVEDEHELLADLSQSRPNAKSDENNDSNDNNKDDDDDDGSEEEDLQINKPNVSKANPPNSSNKKIKNVHQKKKKIKKSFIEW